MGEINKKHSSESRFAIIFETLAYGLQGVLPQLLGFLLLPLYTSVLEPEQYAAANLANVFSLLFSGLITLQIPSIIGRMYYDCEDRDVDSFFSTILALATVVVVATSMIIVVNGDLLVSIVYPVSSLPFFPLFFLAILSVGVSAISSVCSTLLQVQRKATLLLKVTAISAPSNFLLSILLVYILEMGPTGVLAASLTGGLINLSILAFLTREHLTVELDFTHVRPGTSYCLPLVFHYYGGFLFTSSDKIILERFVTLAEVGVYAIAVQMARPMNMLVNAYNRADSPRFMGMSKQSKQETVAHYRETIPKWFSVAMVVWLSTALFGPDIICLLTPSEYHRAAIILPVIAASYVFRGLYCFAVNPLFYEKQTKIIPFITLSAGTTNVVLNLIFVPTYGTLAAAWSTLFSFLVSFLAALVVAHRVYPMSWNFTRLVAISGIALGLFCASSSLPEANVIASVAINLVVVAGLACICAKLSGHRVGSAWITHRKTEPN